MRRLKPLALVVLVACGRADSSDDKRFLEELCSSEQMREEYLDFYWDDVRNQEPALWAEALERCEICPQAINCAPVLSVESWYRTSSSDPKEKP